MFMRCVFTLLFASPLAMLTTFNLVMHHTWLCIMPCSCVVCLPCCVLLLDSSRFVPIVRIRSSTLGSSTSWTRSSSERDFRQDDYHLGSHYYHCYASCFVLSLCCATNHLPFKPPNCMIEPLTHHCPSKPLIGYVTALLSPSYSVVSCKWSWRLLHGGQHYVGISQYLLFN